MAEDLWILVTWAGHQLVVPACGERVRVEQVWEGDGPISVTFDVNETEHYLPSRFARMEAHDNTGLVQTARVVRRKPPSTADCGGPCTIEGEGIAQALRDKVFQSRTIMGPRFITDTDPVIAEQAEDAVEYAVSQLNAGYIQGIDVSAASWPLSDTEDFVGGNALRVINAMTAVAAGPGLPLAWQVKKDLFKWDRLDLSARYQVSIANGAVVEPVDDASRIYNHVVVLYGKNQVASYPDTLTYNEIPTQVDLVVNAGGDGVDTTTAQRLAESIYVRMQQLELGWSCTIKVPFACPLEQVGMGPIAPWRLPTQKVIHITDLDPVNRYGSEAATLDDYQLVTGWVWDGKSNELTIQTSEVRDPSDFVREVMYSGSRVQHALWTPGLSTPLRDADKTPLVGPDLSEAARVVGTPSAVSYGTPAYSKQHEVLLPEVNAAMPYKVIISAASSTGDPFVIPEVADTTNVGTDGRIKDVLVEIPYGKITHWIMHSSVSGSITVKLYRVARNANGSYQTDGSGDPVAGTLLLTAALASEKFTTNTYATTPTDQRPRLPGIRETLPTTMADGDLIVAVISGITDVQDFQLTLDGIRIDPRMPVGHTDFAP